jgi:hypothetical protein
MSATVEQREPSATAAAREPSALSDGDGSSAAPQATKGETGGANGERKGDKGERKHARRWRRAFVILLVLAALLAAARIALQPALLWYVNRTINQSPLYDGAIGDIDISLWRGAYAITDVRINKVTGNVPVPLFAAERVDLAVQWDALLEGKVVGRIEMLRPELNFVDAEDESEDQTGVGGGPWLQIIQDLFPFQINAAVIRDGSVHFRAIDTDPPVNVYLSEVEATIENLSNVHDEVTPLIATVEATALAMDQARLEFEMRLDPSSYRPTFQVAMRLIGLDVTKINDLAAAYGGVDFEHGWFDLVVELDAKEGYVEGYVKPLFRNLKVFSLTRDARQGDGLRLFWEALVGGVSELLENQPRDQFATVIPLRGDLTGPDTNVLDVLFAVLRNAFVRAYLPRIQGEADSVDWLEFGPATAADPIPTGTPP